MVEPRRSGEKGDVGNRNAMLAYAKRGVLQKICLFWWLRLDLGSRVLNVFHPAGFDAGLPHPHVDAQHGMRKCRPVGILLFF